MSSLRPRHSRVGTIVCRKHIASTEAMWAYISALVLTCIRWPAIIGIVIASLIIISIIWCCVRCLCCGMSCCCSCLSCCDCGSRGRKDKGPKHAEGPGPSGFHSPPYQGYQPAPAPPIYEPPRFAQFDAPTKNGKFNGDALPAMPSWDQATSRRVEDTNRQDVELADLEKRQSHLDGQLNGTVLAHGPTGRGGYSQVLSNPPTPNAEYPSTYRDNEVTNPYTSAPTAYGAGAATATGVGAGYARTSPPQLQYPTAHELDHGQKYQRVSPLAVQSNFGYGNADTSYGQANTTPSPYNERPPQNAVNNSYSSHNIASSPVSRTQHQRDYTPYTPSTSTQYEPSTSPPSQSVGDRPPSLLQPGRKPASQTWRAV
jgi:hypothetical protein